MLGAKPRNGVLPSQRGWSVALDPKARSTQRKIVLVLLVELNPIGMIRRNTTVRVQLPIIIDKTDKTANFPELTLFMCDMNEESNIPLI